jgi:hypothetical protein
MYFFYEVKDQQGQVIKVDIPINQALIWKKVIAVTIIHIVQINEKDYPLIVRVNILVPGLNKYEFHLSQGKSKHH